MKTTTPQAAFSFDTYKIVSFTYNEPSSPDESISINFDPSGSYSQPEGKFILTFEFSAILSNDIQLLSAKLEAQFTFEEHPELKDVPDFFYKNSIAIVFPYLRSFISTLTSLANVKHLVLPLLNLSSLEPVLKAHTGLAKEKKVIKRSIKIKK